MIKKKNNIRPFLTNRIFIFFIFVLLISILFAIGINRYRIVHSHIYTNLQGTYEMELDSSYVYRAFDVIPSGFIIQIHKDNICLPILRSNDSDTNTKSYQEFVKLEEESHGTWELISSNPDSIFIDAKEHLLHGKYQVTFKTYKTGSLGYTTANYVYLDNDSTHLCLKKKDI